MEYSISIIPFQLQECIIFISTIIQEFLEEVFVYSTLNNKTFFIFSFINVSLNIKKHNKKVGLFTSLKLNQIFLKKAQLVY